jgi:hypothetical protein
MPYLTLFTFPKGFVDQHIAMIQRNALASWRQLGSEVEVLVMGDDPGVAEAATELGATHLPDAATNEYGTPLLDWAFREAATRGSGEILCYVNADIILLQDFLAALRRLPANPYLAVGQRWDCDVESQLDFSVEASSLGEWARENGKLDRCTGSDYFAYPREVNFDMPKFAVGRPGWDNWLIGRPLELGLPLIDLTPSVTVIHQNHDYRHVAKRVGADWEGPEADRNRALAGKLDRYVHSPSNATHILTLGGGLRRARSFRHARAKAEEVVALNPAAAPLRLLIKLTRRAASRHKPQANVDMQQS